MKEFEYTDSTCEVWYIDNDIEFTVNFDWCFKRWDDEGNIELDVELQDSYQLINGVKHYFYPSIDEVSTMIEAITDHILEDPNNFGFEEHIESEKDFQTDNTEY